jgi:nicotinate-nucleotide adenylyltransferase
VAHGRPGASLKLLIGADNLFDFDQWKRPDEILQASDLVVMGRPGFDRTTPAPGTARATFVTVPQIAISSTDIRRRVRFGQSIRYMVPAGVEEYIRARRLYQQ